MKRVILKGVVNMAFRRNRRERVKEVETKVWTCQNDDCDGWMRKAFSFSSLPICPLCDSDMAFELKMLPELKS